MNEESRRRVKTSSASKFGLSPFAGHLAISLAFFVLIALFLKHFALLMDSGSPGDGRLVGLLVLHAAAWIVLSLYSLIDRDLMMSRRRFTALMLLLAVFIAISKALAMIDPLLIPIPAFTILAGVMFSPSASLYFSGILALYVSLVSPASIVPSLLSVFFVFTMLRRIKLRSQMIALGTMSGLILFLAALADMLMRSASFEARVFFPLLGGILSAVLAIGLMPLFESGFALLTPLRLLELSDPNKPLLKRLLIEAPGTYHHSILVGNLAETAAHCIGADETLSRVAAYYHDVGKLERPFYFKENQFDQPNPHDTLPPSLSARYIKSHLTYGIQLLKNARIPQEIVDIVASHHGTSLIKYFYHKEKSVNPEVDIQEFVYPGPKPKSKEAVILMLADSVEAAVRSEKASTVDSLKALIDKIVDQKIFENQLSDSNLTFSDLDKIKRSFLDVISGSIHQRVAYPDVDLEEVNRSAFDDKSPETAERGEA